MRSETVRKIGFTGSTRVGKLLMKQAADTVKKVLLVQFSVGCARYVALI